MTRVHKLVSLMYVLFKRMFQHLKIVSVLQSVLYMHRVSDCIPKVAFEWNICSYLRNVLFVYLN